MSFAEELKKARHEKRVSLRQLSSETGYDSSNWSKVERGLIAPPGDSTVVKAVATLGSGQNSQYFLDLAAADRGKLPKDIAEDPDLVKAMPVCFAKARKMIELQKRGGGDKNG